MNDRPLIPIPPEFHPVLRGLLEAEIAAGNAIREIGRDWPAKGSVLVRLWDPFHIQPAEAPSGATYLAVKDPHWWMDEYSAGQPPHLLIY